MGGSHRKPEKLPPSYVRGKFRDPTIATKLDPNYGEYDLLALIKKAAIKKAPKGRAAA